MRADRLPNSDVSFDTAISADMQCGTDCVSRPIPIWRRLRRMVWHVLARQFTLMPVVALALARLIGRRRRPVPDDGCEILLTGRFDSNNWILNHLGPLSASKKCSRVWMVSTNPVPVLPKVTAIYPSEWLVRIVGATQARLLTSVWAVMRKRPHIFGGFHIMVNGIVAIVMARVTGARSMYFCVGGPAEVRDGGVHSADSLFTKMETPDVVVEHRFLKVIADSDMIITMGSKGADFFREKGVSAKCYIVSGGIDPYRFQPAKELPTYDLILTGRLVEVKRIDVFLEAVKMVVDRLPDVKALVVGDGVLRDDLRARSCDLGIGNNVSFVGHQENIETWLAKSRVFVLTSDSEGLSLSLMEAMMSGLPAVVSDVGDLGDLVEDGVNGYLVPRRSPERFADRLVELLSNGERLTCFSQAARRSAMRYETRATVDRWNHILGELVRP